MSSRALINSAAAGVAVINAMYMVSEVPTGRAAWGWTQSAPADADFTCEEGEVGCASWKGCENDNFTCTVKPKAHHNCDVTVIHLKCSKNGGEPFWPQQSDPMCLTVGHGDGSDKDSELLWSQTPNCTATSGDDDSDHSGHDHGDHGTDSNSTTATGGAGDSDHSGHDHGDHGTDANGTTATGGDGDDHSDHDGHDHSDHDGHDHSGHDHGNATVNSDSSTTKKDESLSGAHVASPLGLGSLLVAALVAKVAM